MAGYLAQGSGGLWKTRNRGDDWEPIFDQGGSYSLGYVTIDARNPNVLWLGTEFGVFVGGKRTGLLSVDFENAKSRIMSEVGFLGGGDVAEDLEPRSFFARKEMVPDSPVQV